MQVGDAGAGAQGYRLAVEAVEAFERAAGLFFGTAQVHGRRASRRPRGPLAVGIIAIGFGQAAAFKGDRLDWGAAAGPGL